MVQQWGRIFSNCSFGRSFFISTEGSLRNISTQHVSLWPYVSRYSEGGLLYYDRSFFSKVCCKYFNQHSNLVFPRQWEKNMYFGHGSDYIRNSETFKIWNEYFTSKWKKRCNKYLFCTLKVKTNIVYIKIININIVYRKIKRI